MLFVVFVVLKLNVFGATLSIFCIVATAVFVYWSFSSNKLAYTYPFVPIVIGPVYSVQLPLVLPF